jgi:hypothetical protein
MVLAFDDHGVLPVGDHPMTIDQLRESLLVNGPGEERSPRWDKKWRLMLVNNLEIVAKQLWSVGITQIYIDGSFVEDKDHPNDIDGYFECDMYRVRTRKIEAQLNAAAGFRVWSWSNASRRPHSDSHKRELPIWHKYRVELYPHCIGMFSGILDEFGNSQTFPAAFRKSRREHRAKGIIKLEAAP